jgi:hypothetical protein
MATKNLFFKSVPVTYNAGLSDTSTTWARTFNDRIEATESDVATGTIVIYYNGQAILNDTGVGSPTERFYYTVSTSLGPIVVDATTGSTATFTLKANSAYRGPGYASGTSTSTLSNYDTFNVTYYYTVYTA